MLLNALSPGAISSVTGRTRYPDAAALDGAVELAAVLVLLKEGWSASKSVTPRWSSTGY